MNPHQLMQQARKLQEDLARVQAQLGEERVTGEAGGDAVAVTLDGHGKVVAVKVAPGAVDPADVETLEDLLTIAIKDAQAKQERLAAERMGPIAGGLRIPGMS